MKPPPFRAAGAPRPARRGRGEVSLERALSKLGIASRREAREWIFAGRVTIGGAVVRDPARPVTPERGLISIDGQPAAAAPWRALIFHKPPGLITTRNDPHRRPTVFDWLREAGDGLVPVGRLDRDTTGLLLLTNDTRLADWLIDPTHRIPRVYLASVRGVPDAKALAQLVAGVEDRGERLAAERARVAARESQGAQLELILTEGKNREVRRLCAAVGHPVLRLHRSEFGGLGLGELGRGEWRELTRAELERVLGPAAPIGTGPVRGA